jgi:Protein of unknown function (DUF3352)
MNEMHSVEMEVKLPKPSPVSLFAKIVLILGVVAVAGVAAFVLINRAASPTGDPTANVMPANTLMFFSMTTHPDKQPNFNVVADAWKGSKEANQIQSGLVLAVASAGFNWDEDIVPWLGERVGVGIVDLGGTDQSAPVTDTRTLPAYRAPFFLVAAQTRDHAKSDAFLAALARRIIGKSTSMKIQNDTYRGIPFAYLGGTDVMSSLPAWATVNDLVVVTIGPDNLKKAIDAALDGKNLTSSDNFKATMAALPGPNVGAVYMDYNRYMDTLLQMGKSMSSIYGNIYSNLDPQKADEFKKQQAEAQMSQLRGMMQAFGGVGGTLTYEPNGLRFDAVLQFDQARLPEAWRAIYAANQAVPANKVFDSIPAAAMLAFNGNNPASSFKLLLDPNMLSAMFSSLPNFNSQAVTDKIAQFQKLAGVDLKADLFDLFNGEYALTVLPKTNVDHQLPFEVAAMLDASDATHASASLDKIVTALISLSGQSGLQMQPMNRAPYTALLDKQGNIVLAYGVVNNRLVIGSNPDTLDAIGKANAAPLSADTAFKAAISDLPSNRLQTGYITLKPLWDWIGTRADASVSGVLNYLRPIKWITIGSELPANGLMRGSLHIGLEAAK